MVRQVRVKAAYADRYLSLDSEVWYTAAAIAGFVKGTTIVRDGPGSRFGTASFLRTISSFGVVRTVEEAQGTLEPIFT